MLGWFGGGGPGGGRRPAGWPAEINDMARGGSGNMSQRLMRARVVAQAVAIALLMAALFFFGGNHGTPGG